MPSHPHPPAENIWLFMHVTSHALSHLAIVSSWTLYWKHKLSVPNHSIFVRCRERGLIYSQV